MLRMYRCKSALPQIRSTLDGPPRLAIGLKNERRPSSGEAALFRGDDRRFVDVATL